MKRYIFALITCLASLPAIAQVQRVTIYFIPWEIMTRVALSPADVRRSPYIKTEILDADFANSFVQSLDRQPLEDTPRTHVRDVRLVIDIKSKNGPMRTIVANRFDLLDEASGTTRKVDAKFRERFSLVP